MQACDVVIAGVRQCVLRSPGSRLLPGGQCGAEQRHQREPGARHSPRDDAYVRLPQRMVCCGLLEEIIRELRVSLSCVNTAGICACVFSPFSPVAYVVPQMLNLNTHEKKSKKAKEKKSRMTASVLKHDPNRKKVQTNAYLF